MGVASAVNLYLSVNVPVNLSPVTCTVLSASKRPTAAPSVLVNPTLSLDCWARSHIYTWQLSTSHETVTRRTNIIKHWSRRDVNTWQLSTSHETVTKRTHIIKFWTRRDANTWSTVVNTYVNK
ncbi:unnamed protein product [Lymnaea stagnalis]|uniref:Uncharacterized protein n=1 Tax=Lymnaea stagnalis TaxID=6523 RepID=A0AAV2IHF7_LYMST